MKRVILTGGSDGLGKAFALQIVERGGEIVSLSREKPDYKCVHIKTDLTDEKQIENACKIIKEKYGKFDAIVNCAGLISVQDADKITYKELEDTIKVNTLAPIYLVSQLFNEVVANEADILNVGSTVGLKAYTSQSAYTASKWGLRGASKTMQLELAKTKCRVIQFNVGGMNTNFWYKYNGTKLANPDEWMQPKDVAAFMIQLLSLPKNMEVTEIEINRKK